MTGRAPSDGRPRAIVVDPAEGLSGDMFLAGLFALGADPRRVGRAVRSLPGLGRFTIVPERVRHGAILAHRATVRCSASAPERDLAAILRMIDRSPLPAPVKVMAARTFRVIGEAEGKIHGVPASRVHFHEVGAVDSIVDIVGAAAALAELGYPELYHRPFRLGGGSITIAHGRLPLPAPATIEILRGRTVRLGGPDGETVTPTGAALMKALARELPERTSIVPRRVVYAAGTRPPEESPGLLRLVEAEPRRPLREVAVIRTTIDDMNPQIYGHLQELLFETGALEVYLTQLIMKKGRPGALVTVICERDRTDPLLDIVFRETTTIGARVSLEERRELERWVERTATPYGAIAVKKARLGDGSVKLAPEYESCRAAARRRGAPLAAVQEAARAAASKRRTRR